MILEDNPSLLFYNNVPIEPIENQLQDVRHRGKDSGRNRGSPVCNILAVKRVQTWYTGPLLKTYNEPSKKYVVLAKQAVRRAQNLREACWPNPLDCHIPCCGWII